MAKSLKYYFDFLSQPSRAMYIILKLSKTNFESCPVSLSSGDVYTEDFEKINRFKRVPCIVHGDVKLAESIAILRYLHRQDLILDQLYPSDLIKQARVDEYLEWQHLNTRLNGFTYFHYKVLRIILQGKEPNPERVERLASHFNKSLDVIENVWLKSNKFIASNELTAADIFAACEIEQPIIGGLDPFKNRPKLKNWMDQVKTEANPYYEEAHSMCRQITNMKFQKVDDFKFKL